MDLLLAFVCVIAHTGFLRYSEVSNIRLSNIVFHPDYLSIKIPKSKNDQLRQGDQVLIARSGSITSPLAILDRYTKAAGITQGSEEHLFRGITEGKSQALRTSGTLSYTRFSELLKQKLRDLGYPPVEFRSGGATAAAAADVPDRVFKRHGRWRSEKAKEGYIKDTLEKRLSVTKNIGL